jgi:hypothetical protein
MNWADIRWGTGKWRSGRFATPQILSAPRLWTAMVIQRSTVKMWRTTTWHGYDSGFGDNTIVMNNENERIKLQATFWNNLAVAAITGGIAIPVIGYYGDNAVWNATVFPVFSEVAKRAIYPILAAAVLGAACRAYANYLMTKLKD